MLEAIGKIPWNAIDTLINFLELLLLCVPAVVAFVYYKIKSVSILVLDKTPNGASFIIHNKTNKSIFITDISVVSLGKRDPINPSIARQKEATQLKPDDHIKVIVNYTKTSQHKQKFKLIVEYNLKHKKGVKVTV